MRTVKLNWKRRAIADYKIQGQKTVIRAGEVVVLESLDDDGYMKVKLDDGTIVELPVDTVYRRFSKI